jgi:hypothetical protein
MRLRHEQAYLSSAIRGAVTVAYGSSGVQRMAGSRLTQKFAARAYDRMRPQAEFHSTLGGCNDTLGGLRADVSLQGLTGDRSRRAEPDEAKRSDRTS